MKIKKMLDIFIYIYIKAVVFFTNGHRISFPIFKLTLVTVLMDISTGYKDLIFKTWRGKCSVYS